MSAEDESVIYSFEAQGGLVVEVLLLVYLFYMMMVLTDEYLMGTHHSEYIDLSIHTYSLPIEAGACLVRSTQIAFGSIIPEFTVNTIASLMVEAQHNILGLSTVVGSGCFATLTHGHLFYPARIVLFGYLRYLASLFLVIFVVHNYEVSALEAMFLLCLTPFYVYFSFVSPGSQQSILVHIDALDKGPSTLVVRVLKSPVKLLCRALIPTYTGKTWQIVSAFIVIVLLSFGITRLTVFFLIRLMSFAEIPDSLVGLTIISWGNNIGDLMNATVAAKRGNALLAINGLLSTQVLNMLFTLGLPWTLSTLFFGPMHMSDATTEYSLYFAILIVSLSLIAIASACEKMQWKLGSALLVLYSAYIVSEWTFLNNTKKSAENSF